MGDMDVNVVNRCICTKEQKKKQEIPERNLIDKGEKEQADFGDNCTAKTMPAHQGKTETRQ